MDTIDSDISPLLRGINQGCTLWLLGAIVVVYGLYRVTYMHYGKIKKLS